MLEDVRQTILQVYFFQNRLVEKLSRINVYTHVCIQKKLHLIVLLLINLDN